MAVSIFNPKTGRWEKRSTSLASGLKVTDVGGKFEVEEKNVERCLSELKDNLDKVNEEIKYIYENGTIGGGGGGGGGSAFPTITIDGETNIKCSTDQIVNIYYFFQSPNYGRGKAVYSLNNGAAEQVEVNQGRVRKSLGPLPAGVHTLQIYVIDSAGLYSNFVNVTINCGTLELQSSFDPTNGDKDFLVTDPVTIEYLLNSVTPDDPIEVTRTIDGVETTSIESVGRHVWNIGTINKTGSHRISIQARNSTEVSNKLSYTVLVIDAKELNIASDYDTEEISYGKNIIIDYRLSMSGETSFIVEHYINDTLVDTNTNAGRSNYWNVGKLKPGSYKFDVKARTKGENPQHASLTFNTEVVSHDFVPFWTVEDMLLASFNSNGKSNGSDNRNVWEDSSGNNVECKLHGFNYASNGWLQHEYMGDNVTALTFNGKAYAEINLSPFQSDFADGLTIDVMFKVENVGNIDAKVIDCKKKSAPYNGIYAGIEMTSIRTTTSVEADVKYPEREFVRQTYVVDRKNKLLKIFTNGTVSALRVLNPSDSMILRDRSIILGAEQLDDGTITNFSNSAIKSINIYRKSLSDLEVLQNYIADVDEIEEQVRLRELNCLEIKNGEIVTHDNLSIPIMRMIGDTSKMDNVISVPMEIIYIDPNDPSKSFNYEGCEVKWQGTSSLQYPVKNYTIELKDGGDDAYVAPKDGWIPECRFTLKADFMESSHANNIGTANFVQDIYNKYLSSNPKIEGFPAAVPNIADTKSGTRNCIDGQPIKLIIQTPEGTKDMGVYNFNLDRYSHRNYGLFGETKAVSYEIGVNSKDGAGAFMDDSWDSIKHEFKYRYHNAGGETSVTIPNPDIPGERFLEKGKHTELEELVSWVKNTVDPDFTPQFFERFDAHYTLIYYIIVYSLGIIDNLGKNMVLTTWGRDDVTGNTVWYPQFYDLDSMLGLDNEGRMKYGPDVDMASGHFNTSDSLLWKKINQSQLLSSGISEIYKKLRFELKLLTAENFMKFYNDEVIERIGSRFYNEDIGAKYASSNGAHNTQFIYMCNGSRLEQTKRWLEERFIYMDSVFGSLDNSKSVIFRANNAAGVRTLRLKSYSPMWITVSFSDAASNKFKKYVSRDSWTEFTGIISSDTDNNVHITGAKNLMYIDGLKQLNVASALIEEAERLVELDLSESNYLRGVFLGSNRLLQVLKVNDCPLLGQETVNNTIDISNCVNIKHIDVSNSKVANLITSSAGGSLEYLDCSGTKMTSFTISGQEYLEEFNISNCPDLSYINVSNCNSLRSIDSSNGSLITFSVTGCKNITDIDVSSNSSLESVSLSGCVSLRNADVSRCPNITSIDTSETSLEDIDLSGTSSLVNFRSYATNLSSVDLSQSPVIRDVNISSNPRLSNVKLPIMPSIETLNLSGTIVSNIENFTNHGDTIVNLNLAGTRMREVNFGRFTSLDYLNIHNSDIAELDLSKNPDISTVYLSSLTVPNNNIVSLNVSNTKFEKLDFVNGDYFMCPNIRILTAKNMENLESITAPDGIVSVNINNSKMSSTTWSFDPVYPEPLLNSSNLSDYTRVTVNGEFLSTQQIAELKNGTLPLIDDSYVEVYDGILSGNVFFLDSQPEDFPEEGVKLISVFPDTTVAAHMQSILGKESTSEIVTLEELSLIEWIGKSYSFVSPEDYYGYFRGKRVRSFKGLEYLTGLKYINLAGCDYEGVIRLNTPGVEKLDFAFADMLKTTGIVFECTLPRLRTISYAFKDSSKITSIIMPEAHALENCNYAFLNCEGISDIISSNESTRVKYLNGTFKGCTGLKNVKLNATLPELISAEETFEDCMLDSVSYTDNTAVVRASELPLINSIIDRCKKLDLSNMINIEEFDIVGDENTTLEELELSNTKIPAIDITGAYEEEEEVYPDDIVLTIGF